jgi:hypothetical protein
MAMLTVSCLVSPSARLMKRQLMENSMPTASIFD